MKSIIYVNSAKNVNKDSLIKERSVNRIKTLKNSNNKNKLKIKKKNSSKVPTGISLVNEASTHSIVKIK